MYERQIQANKFLSTPSARRATADGHNVIHTGRISIHALCEEGDAVCPPGHHRGQISIHALCEEGDAPRYAARIAGSAFLSTPSARRATVADRHLARGRDISIHALCEEGDEVLDAIGERQDVFLSTPSARRATTHHSAKPSNRLISIHALCEEGDGRRGP